MDEYEESVDFIEGWVTSSVTPKKQKKKLKKPFGFHPREQKNEVNKEPFGFYSRKRKLSKEAEG